jgi:hypothetical protein
LVDRKNQKAFMAQLNSMPDLDSIGAARDVLIGNLWLPPLTVHETARLKSRAGVST